MQKFPSRFLQFDVAPGALDILQMPFGNEDLLAQVRSALCVARERAEQSVVGNVN